MATQETPTDNKALERFQEAKKRYQKQNNQYYNETLSSDKDSAANEMSTLVDFIKNNADKLSTAARPHTVLPSTNATIIAANRNKRGDTSPTERIVQSQKDTTAAIRHLESVLAPQYKVKSVKNKTILPTSIGVKPLTKAVEGVAQSSALKDLEKSIRRTALIEPVKIDDSKIAQENTLEDVAVILSDILKNLVDFSRELIERVTKLISPISKELKSLDDSDEKRQGWMTRWIQNTIDYIKGNETKTESFADTVARLIKPSVNAAKKSTEYLAGIYHTLRRTSIDTDTERARSSIDERGTGALSGLGAILSETVLGKATNLLKGIGNTFKKIGELGEGELKNWREGTDGGGLLARFIGKGSTSSISLIARFLGLFSSVASVITLAVGSVAFASAYAMFKHPEQLIGMLGAFTNLFTEAILPAFKWINKEIVPPLTAAFSALLIAGDYLLDTVGTYVNEKLIYIIGTALPDVLKMFGRMIDDIWQGLKDFSLRIAGIFGVGPYGEEGFIKNLTFAFLTLGDHLMEMVSEFSTEVIKSLGLADFFGLKSGEGVWGRVKRFFGEDIPNYAISLFDKMVNLANELNPIPIIQEKLKTFVDAITSLIPTWDDIKSFIVNSIPSWTPDFVRNTIIDNLTSNKDRVENRPAIDAGAFVGRLVEPVKRDSATDKDPALNPFTRFNNMSSNVVVAPSVTNNTSNISNPASQTNRAIGTSTPPRSRLDDMIFRANPY